MSVKDQIFFAKYWIHQPSFWAEYRRLSWFESCCRDLVEHENLSKRLRLVNWALKNNTFYSSKWREAGINCSTINTESEFQKLPLLTKDDLRSSFGKILDKNVRSSKLRKVTTGGSTGSPTAVMHDLRYPTEAIKWRMLKRWGIQPSDDMACIWRLKRKSKFNQLLNDLLWWPTRRVFLDASSMTEESIADFLKSYNKLKPKLIYSYAGSMLRIAQTVDRLGIKVVSPTAIWLTSSPLTKPNRLFIERVFGAPVYDQYACSEIFWIGAECQMQDGLHLDIDSRHVEILDKDGNPCPTGKEGRVVVTDLNNFAFPLIRYEVGDRACFIDRECECGCGCRLPLISQVKGRVTDMITLDNGVCLDGDYLTTIFDDFPDVVISFQVRQMVDGGLRILYIPISDIDPSNALLKIKQDLLSKTRGFDRISFEAVKEIPHDRGKNRYVISEKNIL